MPFIFLDLAIIVADMVFVDFGGWIMLALVPVFLLHVISFISVYWSADIAAFINYRKVRYRFRHLFCAKQRVEASKRQFFATVIFQTLFYACKDEACSLIRLNEGYF